MAKRKNPSIADLKGNAYDFATCSRWTEKVAEKRIIEMVDEMFEEPIYELKECLMQMWLYCKELEKK